MVRRVFFVSGGGDPGLAGWARADINHHETEAMNAIVFKFICPIRPPVARVSDKEFG